MNKLIYVVLACAFAGCGRSEQSIEVGPKENFDKGTEIMADRNRQMKESNKILDEEAKPKKKEPSAPSN